MPAEEPRHEVLGEGRGRPQGPAPQGANLVEVERPHAVDLGLNRLWPTQSVTSPMTRSGSRERLTLGRRTRSIECRYPIFSGVCEVSGTVLPPVIGVLLPRRLVGRNGPFDPSTTSTVRRSSRNQFQVSPTKWVLDCPDDGNVSDAGRVRVEDRGAVHFPDRNIAAGIAPQYVALAVAIEVT